MGRKYPDLEQYIVQHYEPEIDCCVLKEALSVRDIPVFENRPKPGNRKCNMDMKPRGVRSLRKAVFDEAVFDEAVFDEEDESGLIDRLLHLEDTFSEYLMYLIKERNMNNTDVWKRALVDKKLFSKIKNNPDYQPKKLTALCLCIGAKLNLDESRDLLARAGYALSPSSKTDIIFSYFIENEIYDMIELDIQLETYGEPCIIS